MAHPSAREMGDLQGLFAGIKKGSFPIVALINTGDEQEAIEVYPNEGKWITIGGARDDLMMASSKHEGWVNIYRGDDGKINISNYFPTKMKAIDSIDRKSRQYITTTQIEWEE